MIEKLTPLFWVILTLLFYILGKWVYSRKKISLLNPYLTSLVGLIAVLLGFDIPVSDYMQGGNMILILLPFTIILLALPLYRQLPLLMEHKKAILAGIFAGVTTSGVSVISLCLLLDVDKELIISLIPKSITTPLGLILSETLGGIASVTVIAIVITGILGVIIYTPVFRLFRIKHPVARGVAMGTAAHAIGTSKALELGEETGAMSGLSIVLAGVLTVMTTPLFLLIFSFI
jgi:predicted murein hydrolase (TIGR00659 family)